MRWLGVDVGGPRKGFDVALIDDREVLELRSRLGTSDVVALVEAARPDVVGIDSPLTTRSTVDLPAPLVPRRASTSPLCTSRLTSNST